MYEQLVSTDDGNGVPAGRVDPVSCNALTTRLAFGTHILILGSVFLLQVLYLIPSSLYTLFSIGVHSRISKGDRRLLITHAYNYPVYGQCDVSMVHLGANDQLETVHARWMQKVFSRKWNNLCDGQLPVTNKQPLSTNR